MKKLFVKKFVKYSIFFTLCQGILMSAEIKFVEINSIKIPVIYEEQKSLPTFNMQLVFQNSGSIKDEKLPGLANLSAKILNEGTKELGSIKFANKLESRAIGLHAENGSETFVIELNTLKSEYPYALKYTKELLDSPNITQKSLDKLKLLQLGNLKRKENDYDYVAKKEFRKLLFEGTPLENSSLGTVDSINKITLENIASFIDSSLTLKNLIIVAGGDVSFKELKVDLKKLLIDLKVGKENSLEKITLANNPKESTVIKETEQAYIYFGSPFYIDSKDEDTYLSKVASFILGGSGFGSRMMEEVRVKRGLAYSAYSSVSINKAISYFSGYLQTKLESADEAHKLVKEIVKEFVKNGVTSEELESAKKFLIGSEPLRVETLSQRQNRAFSLYYKGLPQDYPQKELEKIENLTLDELNKFIKSHKEITNLTFSIVRK